MGVDTAISWTDHTFNPWWGCTAVSPACDHCYAETFAKRTGHSDTGSKPAIWGKTADRRFFGDKHWAEPRLWDRAAAERGHPALVFCASMADVFEARADLDWHRARLWDLIDRTPHLIWMLLTKRPEQVNRMVPASWVDSHWPSTVWIGTTVEDQHHAELRIPRLLTVPAPVRFLSCEPLLGPVDLAPWIDRTEISRNGEPMRVEYTSEIGWVIVGGESGAGHRPFVIDHASALRDQCATAGVPFFFKQHGGQFPASGGHLLDGVEHHAWPASAGER